MSQEVTKILKSQIGHATHAFWSNLATKFDNLSIGSCEAIFQQFIVKFVLGSGRKCEISSFIKANKKGVYQMPFELMNPMVPSNLLCDFWNMLQYHLNCKRYPMASLIRIQKSEISYKSAILRYIELTFQNLFILLCSITYITDFFPKTKIFFKNFQTFLESLSVFFF